MVLICLDPGSLILIDCVPPKHYIPSLLPPKLGLKNSDPRDAEVFTPVDAPSGHIVGVVERDPSSKL